MRKFTNIYICLLFLLILSNITIVPHCYKGYGYFIVMMNISFINDYHAFSGIVGTDISTFSFFLYMKEVYYLIIMHPDFLFCIWIMVFKNFSMGGS